LDLEVHIHLRYLNFSHHKAKSPHHQPIFPVTLSYFSNKGNTAFSYWYKPPHTHSPAVQPLVISHGIGIGLTTYLPLLTTLALQYPDIPIYCIENPHISMRYVKEAPTKEEVCRGVRTMLHQEGYATAVFLGHSVGAMTLTCLLHNPATRPLIGGLIFMDPINFLLHLPDVAYNFLYRTPTTPNEMLYSFIAKEPGIASYLFRRFCWFEGILWKDEYDTTSGSSSDLWRGMTATF
jgi:hypothetical protein